MRSSLFRAHEDVPDNIVSPLFRQLVTEWVALHRLPSTATAFDTWRALEPALAHHRRPCELLDAVDVGSPQDCDAVLLALIRLAQDGHTLAGRVVLHAMLPKLAVLAAANRRTGGGEAAVEDRRHRVVADAWTVIATYPVARRPTKVAANLAWETLRRLSLAARAPILEVPTEPDDLPDTPVSTEPELTGGPDPDADLAELLTWALGNEVINPQDAALLRLVYTPTRPGRGSSEAVAAIVGLTPATVRQRCSRARRRLTDAVQAASTLDG